MQCSSVHLPYIYKKLSQVSFLLTARPANEPLMSETLPYLGDEADGGNAGAAAVLAAARAVIDQPPALLTKHHVGKLSTCF